MLCPSTLWFIILSRNSNTLQSTEGEVANLFRPRIVICAVILTSTNKWDIEPGLLSLVINHIYSVARFHNWLIENNCYHVCMESTGKYWYLDDMITQTEVELYVRIKPYYEFVGFVSTMPGITELSSTIVLAETGVDMNIFDDAKHLCSWCGLSPANNESAGKKKSVWIAKAGDYLKPMMVQCALAAKAFYLATTR